MNTFNKSALGVFTRSALGVRNAFVAAPPPPPPPEPTDPVYFGFDVCYVYNRVDKPYGTYFYGEGIYNTSAGISVGKVVAGAAITRYRQIYKPIALIPPPPPSPIIVATLEFNCRNLVEAEALPNIDFYLVIYDGTFASIEAAAHDFSRPLASVSSASLILGTTGWQNSVALNVAYLNAAASLVSPYQSMLLVTTSNETAGLGAHLTSRIIFGDAAFSEENFKLTYFF